jgi:hypothetical protein
LATRRDVKAVRWFTRALFNALRDQFFPVGGGIGKRILHVSVQEVLDSQRGERRSVGAVEQVLRTLQHEGAQVVVTKDGQAIDVEATALADGRAAISIMLV